ncbi:MAG: hypothetical protein A2X63_03495 [Ignavibacteria bacterium GWA2_35_8]|nr:MAG: hypothetical protein A2X63_03495 [Ignavibacteria bacterium GWA2_35_8]
MQSEVKIKAENNTEWVEYYIRPSVATYGCLQDSGIYYVYTPNKIRGYSLLNLLLKLNNLYFPIFSQNQISVFQKFHVGLLS